MIDLVLLAVIGVSALLGLLRGFVGIVVGTLSCLLAGWASFRFGGQAGRWLADGAEPSLTQYLGGYALTFVAVMLVVGVIGMLIRSAVKATQLTGTDRALGFGLGLLRGGLIACVLVLLMGFTPLTREPGWRESLLLPLLQPGTDWMRAHVPDWSMPQLNLPAMDLGTPAEAGDNAQVDQAPPAPGLQQALSRALGAGAAAPHQPAEALPPNIDPAQTRSGDPDPARDGPHGQARPPSQ